MLSKRSLWLLLMVFLAGCGSSNGTNFTATNSPSQAASGTASFYVQGPPVTGQVSLLDSSGQVLAQSVSTTSGVATLPIPANTGALAQGAASFRINFEVQNPQALDAGDGPANFAAEVTSLEAGEVEGLDEVSTLIARYHQAHPELTLQQAAVEIFKFLGLPEDTPIEHYFANTPFESELSLAQSRSAGGFDNLVDTLVDEASGGNSSGGRFVQDSNELSPTALAEKLSDSAQGYLKEKAIGWLEGVIGLNDPDTRDVLAAINSVRDDIRQLNEKISALANTQEYNQKELVLASKRGEATADTETLTQWADPDNHAPPSESQIAAKMAEIRTRYTGTLGTAATLELPEIGSDGNQKPGLAGLFLNAAAPRLYGAPNKAVALYHFHRSLDFQQLVLNLLVEAYHYADPALLGDAEADIDKFLANARLQEQQYPLPFDESKILLDRGTNLMWSRLPSIVEIDNGEKPLEAFLNDFTLGGSPKGAWRLPTVSEFATLASAVHTTGVDQHQNIAMKDYGFLPIDGATEVGDWGADALPATAYRVLTAPFKRQYFSGWKGYLIQATSVDLRNFRSTQDDIVAAPNLNRKWAFYVTRKAPEIESLRVTEGDPREFNRQYRAIAHLSDGSNPDVTELVKWSVLANGTAVTNSVARISNLPGSSGLLTMRVSGRAGLQVKATYRNLEATSAVSTLTFITPAITSLVISPLRLHVDSSGYTNNTFDKTLKLRAIRANGAIEDVDSGATWTSTDTTVAVSSTGRVTAPRPTAKKIVTIKAQIGQIAQTSTLILDP